MKTTLCFTLILFTFVMLAFVPNSFAQNASPEYIVKLYYVVPSDQEPLPNIDATLKREIKKSQLAFAELMENHGFDRKTFSFETDADGNAVVHQIKGAVSDANYYDKFAAAIEKIYGRYSANVNEMQAIIDEHPNTITLLTFEFDGPPYFCGEAGRLDRVVFVDSYGGCLGTNVIAHELAHFFGLWHHDINDDDVLIPNSYTSEPMLRSLCSAEWVNVSRYFNADPDNSTRPTTTQMLPPLASSPNAVRLRFEVADPDGLHVAQLVVPALGGGDVIAYKRLQGEKEIVEFETTRIGPLLEYQKVTLMVIDKTGDITDFHSNTFQIDITPVLPTAEVVSVPDRNLAGVIRQQLNFASNVPITQLDMLKIESLSAADLSIKDLTGLEHAINLRELHLERNQIQDIAPLRKLTRLWYLNLSNNQISNVLPLAGLIRILYIEMGNNEISDVSPLTELVNLHGLGLEGNPIEDRKPLLELLKKNPVVNIYLKEGGQPLPVSLSHFRAEQTDAGVVLKWTTESEVDNAGFYIYRSKARDGEFKVVNPTMVQGAGTTGERKEYTWTDTTAKPNTVYYYQIEDVSHAGVREQLATVRLRGLVSARGKLTTIWADLKVDH